MSGGILSVSQRAIGLRDERTMIGVIGLALGV